VTRATPLKGEGIVSRTVAGETVLVPIARNVAHFDRAFTLNRVGAFLWAHLDGQRDRAQLAQLVRDQFAVPAERDVDGDVEHFLAALTERGLLQVPA